MSAPETDIPKQTRRHAPSLIAMALAVLFGVGVLGWWALGGTSDAAPEAAPGGALIAPADVAPPMPPAE